MLPIGGRYRPRGGALPAADFIVMGARGFGSLGGLLLGAVAKRLEKERYAVVAPLGAAGHPCAAVLCHGGSAC